MDQLVTAIVTPVVAVVTSGLALVIFAVVWAGFAAAIVWSQGSLDATWTWIRDLPLLIQGVVWLLFLPVMVGLWVWETTWPLALRLTIVLGLAGWNLLVFIPRAAADAKP